MTAYGVLRGAPAGPREAEGGQRGGLAGEFGAAQRGLGGQLAEGFREPFRLVTGDGIDSFQ